MNKFVGLLILLVSSGSVLQAQDLSSLADFHQQTDQLLKEVVQGEKVNYPLIDREKLGTLVKYTETASLQGKSDSEKKAFYINAYNLQVLKGVVDNYPLSSVQKIPEFFERQEHRFLGRSYSLNSFEKELLTTYPDARLHFALSCAAVSCPPLAGHAFMPEVLDQQLDERSTMALNDARFLRVEEGKLALSQIFRWYAGDFGGNRENIVAFINQYREEKLDASTSLGYYPYDWTLNDANLQDANNAARYVVSSTRPKGTIEAKWFNNLYTQQISGRQESYFTSQLGVLYGLSDRVNVGFDVRQRYVAFHPEPSGAFDAFSSTPLQSRSAIATIGPKVRVAPNIKWPNFSIQSAVWFPLVDELEGGDNLPWLDWSSPTWFTQIWNDFSIGSSYAFFLELDLFWEDISLSGAEDATNRFVTPITGILSYFPTPKSTLYGLANFAPIWTPNADYWSQAGLGAKYQIHQNFEIELLYTYFFNQFLIEQSGRASTFNIGFRYSN